ncbi:MAG TPA: hypothetical protein VIJ14_00090, partial [Rhabdochlamydiaceae bacterium]
IQISWFLTAGSGEQVSPGSWVNAGYTQAAAGQANLFGSNVNAFYLALPKWEPGPSFTGWYPETFTEVLKQCQRFYYKTFPQGTAPAQNAGLTGAITWSQVAADPANLRGGYFAFPSSIDTTSQVITFYNPSAANNSPRNITIGADSNGVSPGNESSQGMGIFYATATGSAAGNVNAVHVTIDTGI